ncbi:hypothetical protein OH76DRAFT_480270 [Lentinus brumalis]|uniref:Uncharacterized protein n=1 Tax=Lentinus brumalis TaxID=2498619 RepID=A0A371DBZ6_9APHY|nr:hypothetical protein OH76DRAFT_480270 [Polyporus brumalis]
MATSRGQYRCCSAGRLTRRRVNHKYRWRRFRPYRVFRKFRNGSAMLILKMPIGTPLGTFNSDCTRSRLSETSEASTATSYVYPGISAALTTAQGSSVSAESNNVDTF